MFLLNMHVNLGALCSWSARVNLRIRYLCGTNSGSGAERDCGGFQRTKKHDTNVRLRLWLVAVLPYDYFIPRVLLALFPQEEELKCNHNICVLVVCKSSSCQPISNTFGSRGLPGGIFL